ncbi:P-loop containing nucleoside triphosphate hydrolase protein [Marasmius fiardii PR-910]|nr:P-loop containing nucleoside triphosphate hydrolase protein [Marasmius fiardii PR-910]
MTHATPSTITQLFHLLSRRHALILLLPAIFFSMVSGGVAPFMTLVVGQVFQSFSIFPLPPAIPSPEDKKKLLHDVGISAIYLIGLAVGSVVLSSITSALWISVGEHNVLALRRRLFKFLSTRPLSWYDVNIGQNGPAGLVAQFTKDTDSVRVATSLASGLLIQHITTTITALALAFSRSAYLTLLTLSAIPLLTLTQVLSQFLCSRRLGSERNYTAQLGSLLSTTLNLLPTVQLFSLQSSTLTNLTRLLANITQNDKGLNTIWGFSSGTSQFFVMAMFVQSFWFGSKLIREGKLDAGGVSAVFWACLIASSNLQMCMPQLIAVGKGRVAMGGCFGLLAQEQEEPADVHHNRDSVSSDTPSTRSSLTFAKRPSLSNPHSMRKIHPNSAPKGELTLHSVTFSYPSQQSSQYVVQNVEMFLPSGEMTFIVGGSGSGKSTLVSLLAGLYHVSEGLGQVLLDDQDIRYLDESWVREHVGVVWQGTPPLLPNASIHTNIAIALCSSYNAGTPTRTLASITRAEVIDACRAVLLHDFIRDLPEGYDTILGVPSPTSNQETDQSYTSQAQTSGIHLSPGQLQRLSLARAYLRNPSVLILDEPTSALDPVSRELVMAAVRRWRGDKTTIVVGHELGGGAEGDSSIGGTILPTDFVYVMRDGAVAECGFRADLERNVGGEFHRLLKIQQGDSAFQASSEEDGNEEDESDGDSLPTYRKSQFLTLENRLPLGRLTLAASGGVAQWMLDVVGDLTAIPSPGNRMTMTDASRRNTMAFPRVAPIDTSITRKIPPRLRRTSSFELSPITASPTTTIDRRMSLQFTPSSPTFPTIPKRVSIEDDTEFDKEKVALESSGRWAQRRPTRRTVNEGRKTENLDIQVSTLEQHPKKQLKNVGLFALVWRMYPTIPAKPLLFLGMTFALLSGAMTPVFSFLLSKLLVLVSSGPIDNEKQKVINWWGGIVLSIVAADGLMLGLKFYVMEGLSCQWINSLRLRIMTGLVNKPRVFFQSPGQTQNTPMHLTHALTSATDDARLLLSTVITQLLLVVAMFAVGLIWALVRGWELTLAGVAVAPVFAGVMALQAKAVAKCVRRAREQSENVEGGVWVIVANAHTLHSSSLLPFFVDRFNIICKNALSSGVRGAFIEGSTYGIASGLIYLAEALLFFVGAVLVSNGRYSYLRMMNTLTLVVFTVSIGSQLMAFTNRIARGVDGGKNVLALLEAVEGDHQDTEPRYRPAASPSLLSKSQDLRIRNLTFAYPSQPQRTVFHNVSLSVHSNELVAIVGPSGCGKSTLGLLLEKEYDVEDGCITIGSSSEKGEAIDLKHLDSESWRKHLAVVEQGNTLFDLSIKENIAIGSGEEDFESEDSHWRRAARDACVDAFIPHLEHKYDTKAGKLSGGQGQRVMIARALAKLYAQQEGKLMILDECTSALDAENQQRVMEALVDVCHSSASTRGILITHRLPAMRMCDRIVCLGEGGRGVVEQGTFEELMERKGWFARLASGGEWLD